MPLEFSSVRRETLRVLVNGVSASRGGGATFFFEQLRSLELLADTRLTILTTVSARAAVRESCPRSDVLSWPVRSLPLRILREQTTIPSRAGGYDVLYVPGNFAIARASVPQVLVLQSLWHFGEQARAVRARCDRSMRVRVAAESLAARASVRKADRVICVSETMRSSVVEDFGDLEKLTVVSPAPPRLPTEEGRKRLTDEYVLSVGTDMPHKDWTGLIHAFERHRELPPLVLVGWCSQARRLELASSGDRVSLLGPVIDRGELAGLYRHATCVLAHSHLESYGLTAVEALSVGAPLAASDIPAHREFCGSAAHYYDPCDGDALAAAAAEAIRAGPAVTKAPALALTWAENAAMTAATMRSAIDEQR
jgi:glycosyltransferase involved in cell wall biosynthesis